MFCCTRLHCACNFCALRLRTRHSAVVVCCHQQHSMLLIVLYHVYAALTALLAREYCNTPLLCLCCTPLLCRAVGFHLEQKSECLVFAGAYIARQAAKSVVAGGLAKRCLVQISYAIGVAQPLSVYVDTYGTGSIPDKQILAAVLKAFDFRPGMSLLGCAECYNLILLSLSVIVLSSVLVVLKFVCIAGLLLPACYCWHDQPVIHSKAGWQCCAQHAAELRAQGVSCPSSCLLVIALVPSRVPSRTCVAWKRQRTKGQQDLEQRCWET